MGKTVYGGECVVHTIPEPGMPGRWESFEPEPDTRHEAPEHVEQFGILHVAYVCSKCRCLFQLEKPDDG